MYIYLFRHGKTFYNINGEFTGWINAKLSPEGILNAKEVAKKLKNTKIDIGIHSGLIRAKDTLKEVLKNHPECKEVIIDQRIKERNYGKLNRKFHKTIIKMLGQGQYDLWHRDYKLRPPEGESFKDVEKRVKSFIKDLVKMVKKDKVNVAIAAHGNSIRLFRKIAENLSEKEAQDLVIPYDQVYIYKIS